MMHSQQNIKPILLLSFHLCLYLPSAILSVRSVHQNPCDHLFCLPHMPHGIKCGSFEYLSTVYIVPFTGYADADVYTSRGHDSHKPTLRRTKNRL